MLVSELEKNAEHSMRNASTVNSQLNGMSFKGGEGPLVILGRHYWATSRCLASAIWLSMAAAWDLLLKRLQYNIEHEFRTQVAQ